jgi:hypothetical protein
VFDGTVDELFDITFEMIEVLHMSVVDKKPVSSTVMLK